MSKLSDIIAAGSNSRFGWLPDPKDGRDYKFSVINKVSIDKVPKKVNMRGYMTPVENQGWTSSCVAQACVGALEYLYYMKILGKRWSCLKPRDYSRLFVYYFARMLDGFEGSDSGCYIRSAIKAMSQFGVCQERHWEFNNKTVLVKPDKDAIDRAKIRRVVDYYRVDNRDNIICALAAEKPVIFGAHIFNSFMNTADGHIPMPNLTVDKYAGAHAMLVVGYNLEDEVFIVRNSWGEKWGNGGYCWMPFGYFTIGELVDDCWVIRTHPDD